MNDVSEVELMPGTPNIFLAVWLLVGTGYLMFAANTLADAFKGQ